MIWYSSDTHFFHRKILEYSVRPFPDVFEMNDAIINRWNSRILPSDTLYFLGDWAFDLSGKLDRVYELRERIRCERIHFILGNHDHIIRKNRDTLLRDKTFLSISDVYTVNDTKPKVFLSHYSHRIWNKSHHGVYHLYGHSHGALEDDPASLSFDCGVDTNNFYPYSMDDVHRIMSRKTWHAVDHHTRSTVQ